MELNSMYCAIHIAASHTPRTPSHLPQTFLFTLNNGNSLQAVYIVYYVTVNGFFKFSLLNFDPPPPAPLLMEKLKKKNL